MSLSKRNVVLIAAAATLSLAIAVSVFRFRQTLPVATKPSGIPSLVHDSVSFTSSEQPLPLATNRPELATSADSPDEQTSYPAGSYVLDSSPKLFDDPYDWLHEEGLDTSDAGIRATVLDRNQSLESRYLSAIALGSSQVSDALEILQNILNDAGEDSDMRIAAIIGLAYVGDSRSRDVLQDILSYHPNDNLRQYVINAFLHNPSEESLDIVNRTVVDQSQSQEVRMTALNYLSLADGPAVANTMRTLLVDSSHELRIAAAVLLAKEHITEVNVYLVDAVMNEELPLTQWHSAVLALKDAHDIRGTEFRPIDYFNNPEARPQTKSEIEQWWRRRNSQ